jgi:hypothetical protein
MFYCVYIFVIKTMLYCLLLKMFVKMFIMKYIFDMIYLLTAVGLSPGGSTHLHTNNT